MRAHTGNKGVLDLRKMFFLFGPNVHTCEANTLFALTLCLVGFSLVGQSITDVAHSLELSENLGTTASGLLGDWTLRTVEAAAYFCICVGFCLMGLKCRVEYFLLHCTLHRSL